MCLSISVESGAGRVQADIRVENIVGHKFPTGYPSRRTWLHLTVRDAAGRVVFESGALNPNGSITGNDNDADARNSNPIIARSRRPTRCRSMNPSWPTPTAGSPRGC